MVSRRKLRGMDVFFNDPRTPGAGEDFEPLPLSDRRGAEPAAPVSTEEIAKVPAVVDSAAANAAQAASPALDVVAGQTGSDPDGSAAGAGRMLDLPISELRFLPEQQPRDMLPSDEWLRLVAIGENTAAGTLAALRGASSSKSGDPRPASRRVYEHVMELAESIKSDGVLVPLIVLRVDSAYVVLDGHCRAMAATISGLSDVPARVQVRVGDGADVDLTDAAQRFVLNWTQKRLSPLEAARQVQRIYEIAARVIALRQSPPDASTGAEMSAEMAEVARLAEGVDAPADDLAPGQTRAQEIEAAIRRLVLTRTGLSISQYFVLRQINNLHADAWNAAEGLSEGHLRAIVTAPSELHLILVGLVQLARASVKETKAYARAARDQGEEYLNGKIAELQRRREAPVRQRTSVSWEPLLHAMPDDLTPRLSALYAELGALDDERRAVRLRAVARQIPLLEELSRAYRELMERYGPEMAVEHADDEVAESI